MSVLGNGTPPSPAEVRAARAELPCAVTVVTTWDGEEPRGATLATFASLSLEPPMVLACFETTSDTLRALSLGTEFAVHILGRRQQDVARQLAGRDLEKFERVSWRRGIRGLPEIDGCGVVIAAAVARRFRGGDHVVVLGEVLEIEMRSTVEPLVYHRRRMYAVGDEPLEEVA
jgi:3-hydroxy-9,10-secoandrosta-1,3,5(10)-triene-9,17-dione monooxygenase reductase component